MADSTDIHERAADLPEGDVVAVLLAQHAQVRAMFTQLKEAAPEERQQRFDALRALLAVHETAEEMVLRPVSAAADKAVADARNQEEADANVMLAELERLDVTSADFDRELARFEEAVLQHAEAEEREEFPRVLDLCDENQRTVMGTMLRAAEAVAPTHPHPSTAGSTTAQWVAGPFASIVDRTRDAINAARR